MTFLKLVSLNVEFFRHRDAVRGFLSKEAPDVACLHEVCESDLQQIADSFGASQHFFAPITMWPEGSAVIGEAIFSRIPISHEAISYYHGSRDDIRLLDFTTIEASNATKSLALLSCEAEKDGKIFRIATTHFTWTPDGEPDDYQRRDMKAMLKFLEPLGEVILCGDFNATRGGEIFTVLAKRYKDNIPPEHTTSIDRNLHRKGQLNRMVDGLFTTPGYKASNVELRFGISDHAAVVADIQKT